MSSNFTKNIISTYYRKRFSLKPLLEVIGTENFSQREFGFLLDKRSNQFVRNLSFDSPSKLKQYLIDRAPWAAYVGAMYKKRPNKERSVTSLSVEKRELVFDLDLTDYNDIRDCGKEKNHYCRNCWPLVRKAALFIDETLKADFGFKEIKWFFSGRRGFHAWVLGEKSQQLTKEAREAIIAYLSPRDQKNLSRRFIQRVLNILCDDIPTESKVDRKKIYEKLPRLDRKVTIDLRRLMRIPGSLHQATGRPNTPTKDLREFYPDDVPYVWEMT